MANGNARFHVEVADLEAEGCKVRFNIFGDTLGEVITELESVLAYCSGQPVRQTELTISKSAVKGADVPSNGNGSHSNCPFCKSVGSVELVKWNDKNTGQPRQASKCRSCNKWLR